MLRTPLHGARCCLCIQGGQRGLACSQVQGLLFLWDQELPTRGGSDFEPAVLGSETAAVRPEQLRAASGLEESSTPVRLPGWPLVD